MRSVRFGLTEEEHSEVAVAAAHAGLAKGAYAAHATLAAARGLVNPADTPSRQALAEVIRAAGLVRRIGVNLNQAVAKLNATGQRSADLLPYAAESLRRARRLDAAADGRAEASAVIGKVLRGQRPGGLLYYLFGPGRREEHADQHIIAGWRDPAELEPPLRPDYRRDFRRLTGLLNQPHAALGPRGLRQPVWHCAVRASPGDREALRRRAVRSWCATSCTGPGSRRMAKTTTRSAGSRSGTLRIMCTSSAHWPARMVGGHGSGTTTSAYGTPARRQRNTMACVAPRPVTVPLDNRPTRAESEKARRHGRPETPRVTLRRIVSTAAAGAASEEEFFIRLREAGVLVRTRISTRDPGQVTGYAVALDGDTARTGGPVWFGGGKLAYILTLPKLRCRWGTGRVGTLRGADLTVAERNAIWRHAARTAQSARDQIHAAAAVGDVGSGDRCGMGGLRHTALRGRRPGQPGHPPGRRQLRPRGPDSLMRGCLGLPRRGRQAATGSR